ncbi:MAG: 1-acyl-sn-glycerol-3-phosphate acyltransferase [Bacteroidales bacterium]|jgi:1-acyl-sn-glycerol-3-phosphate acyltransferase|nr:1-acyl-sn-glycerol-3-phosphate acyltransferase [Bacteroidales bacterium]
MIFDIFITENDKSKTDKTIQASKPEMGYKAVKAYTRFFHDKIYYRKVYYINTENIPENCPLMVVSNHQNCMCDPLGLLMSMRARQNVKTKVITRANIFSNSIVSRILRYLGLIPIFRLEQDGAENLVHNNETFEEVENELLNDGTVIIFPEGKHQNKRWLGDFSYGYLRILFKAAEKSNFEKELFVLPSCNHYSNYFGIQEDLLIKFGNPISLAPYYELYKTKPRTAQRKVNALVRNQMEQLMLNINDLDNYTSIDYLRETYGIKYAKDNGYNPNVLPEKLISDKEFCRKLEDIKEKDENVIHSIYNDVNIFDEKTRELNIKDENFGKISSFFKVFVEGLLFIVFFPLFVFSLIPNILVVYAPKVINSKIEDRMMHNTIVFIMSLLCTMPILYLLIFALVWILKGSFIYALIYLICLPFLGIFAWNYNKAWKSWRSQLRYKKLLKAGKLNELVKLRTKIYESLDKLLK